MIFQISLKKRFLKEFRDGLLIFLVFFGYTIISSIIISDSIETVMVMVPFLLMVQIFLKKYQLAAVICILTSRGVWNMCDLRFYFKQKNVHWLVMVSGNFRLSVVDTKFQSHSFLLCTLAKSYKERVDF